MNDAIRHAKVRLIGSDGEQLGVLTTNDARERAYDEGLDLVEVSAAADPPVCRIMNYDKFRYEQKKKLQEDLASRRRPSFGPTSPCPSSTSSSFFSFTPCCSCFQR